jgi:hypothetical protein
MVRSFSRGLPILVLALSIAGWLPIAPAAEKAVAKAPAKVAAK